MAAGVRAPWTQVWGALLLACCSGVDLASASTSADDAMLFPWQGQLGRTEVRPIADGEGVAKPLPGAPGGEMFVQVRSRMISTNALMKAVAEERAMEDGHSTRERKLLAEMGRLEREYEASKVTEAQLKEKLDQEQAHLQALSAKHTLALKAQLTAEQRAEHMQLLAKGGILCAVSLAVWMQRLWFQDWVAGKWRTSLRDGVTGGPRQPLNTALKDVCSEQEADVEAGLFAAAAPDSGKEAAPTHACGEPSSLAEQKAGTSPPEPASADGPDAGAGVPPQGGTPEAAQEGDFI